MPRRLAQLLINTDLLEMIFRDGVNGFVPVAHHLPGDVHLCGAYTPKAGLVGLVFSSEQFPDDYPLDAFGTIVADLPALTPIDLRPRHRLDIPLSLN